MNYVVATYLARFAGILVLVPALFPDLFIAKFPGIISPSVRGTLFIAGIAIYAGASIAYYLLRKREQEQKNERDL
jgi:hypothetical protein